jgi:hypothetical protein
MRGKMKRQFTSFLMAVFMTASIANAEVAPPTMKDFNKTCPSKVLCLKIEKSYQSCNKDSTSSVCAEFVKEFRQLLPIYDCQRPFDHTEGVDYIVPAVWLCDGQRGDTKAPYEFEDYVRLLSKLKSKKARELFGSQEFRDVLDGAVAEEFGDFSHKVGKELMR